MDVEKIRIEWNKGARSQKTGIWKQVVRERWRTEDGDKIVLSLALEIAKLHNSSQLRSYTSN